MFINQYDVRGIVVKSQTLLLNVFKKGFRGFLRKYGPLGIAIHVSISTLSTICFYVAIRSGLDVQSLIAKITSHPIDPKATAFGLAFLLNKAIEPIRLPLTIILTPIIRNRFWNDDQTSSSSTHHQENAHNTHSVESKHQEEHNKH